MLQLFLLFNVLIIIVYAHMLCGVTEEVRGQLESPFCPSAMWIPGLKNKCSYQPKTSQSFLVKPERLGPEWYGNPEEGERHFLRAGSTHKGILENVKSKLLLQEVGEESAWRSRWWEPRADAGGISSAASVKATDCFECPEQEGGVPRGS